MKTKRQLQRSDQLWISAALLLLVLQFWWLPGSAGSAADSRSNTIDGTLGFWMICEELFPEVIRDSLQLAPEEPGVLFINNPARLPIQREEQQLEEFVRSGGSLLFVPPALPVTPRPIVQSQETRSIVLDRLGIRLQEINTVPSFPETPQTIVSRNRWSHSSLPQNVQSIQSDIETDSPQLASYWQLGSGRVLVCLDTDMFSNSRMLDPAGARNAVRLLEVCRDQAALNNPAQPPVVFSEYLTAAASYRGTGILFSPILRLGMLQLLLALIFLLWRRFHCFGPVPPALTPNRRCLTESAVAMGGLQFRGSGTAAAVRHYRTYLQQQLHRRFGRTTRLEASELLAQQSGVPIDLLELQLRKTLDEARSPATRPANAAKAIRWLAGLHSRLEGSGKPTRKSNQNNQATNQGLRQ